jgi:serine/threonine protein kinase
MLIGRYKLLQQIGEGGFGVVFMAEQIEPVQRKVALKVIKAGMDTREVIARFEAERQALALMDHPNIARVLDGGATASGRPYFVMELVRGAPITEYCDQCTLNTRERLELFIQVCRAVQHAHQKGVIHRDLKPTNVLVTLYDGVPMPKVIDFGVAKALGQRLTGKTLFTRFEQMIGTPAYMSPEQAALSGSDIDTRSDIYSLGVLLYELLTGVTPFDRETLAKAALNEVRRIIQEAEPLKPSTRLLSLGERLSEVARHRHAEPASLTRSVRGDLDWITMKALEKDRRRRYETVNGLASDLQRHLSNEAVVARPPGTFYRFQKLLKRNKLPFVATSAAAVVFAVSTAAVLALAYHLLAAAVGSKDREVLEATLKEAAAVYEGGGVRALQKWARSEPEQFQKTLMVRLVNASSHVSFITAPADWVTIRDVPAGPPGPRPRTSVIRIPQSEERDFLLASAALSGGSVLQVGRSTNSREVLLNPIRRLFLIFGSITVVLSFLAGPFVIRRAMQPGTSRKRGSSLLDAT